MADETLPLSKVCSKCGKEKPASEFHRCKAFRDGLTYKCKTCVKEYQEQNPDKIAGAERRRKEKRALKTAARELDFQEYLVRALKVCSKCSVEKSFEDFSKSKAFRDGRYSICKECISISNKANKLYFSDYAKKWCQRNPDKAKEKNRRNREKHREKHNAATRAWRERNKDYVRECEANRKDKETRPAKRRAQYAADPTPHRESRKRYRQENPETHKAAKQRRRARKRNAPGSHTAVQRIDLLARQQHICANPYCRADLRIVMRNLDHIVALAKGGSNDIANMQWLCRPCNSRKTTLSQEEWLRREAERHRKTG